MDAEQGLRGFTAHLTDVFGTVSVDYYGNALCTVYQHQNAQRHRPDPLRRATTGRSSTPPRSTGTCVSDRDGQIVDPQPGPEPLRRDRHPARPATGQTYQWVQTTTLEGGHDHDIWEQEGATGFDTEQTKGAELVPDGPVRLRADPGRRRCPDATLPDR